jgi:hypothetical protein
MYVHIVGVSQKEVDFSKKISKIKIIFDLIFTDVHTDRQKLGTKVVQSFQKITITKPFSKLIFFNEKKRKDSNDF